jgi:hypothetical protein
MIFEVFSAVNMMTLSHIPLYQEFSLLHVVQTGSDSHPVSEALSLEIKRQGRDADHSPPTSAEVKEM